MGGREGREVGDDGGTERLRKEQVEGTGGRNGDNRQ
jgi:hypothetical protein